MPNWIIYTFPLIFDIIVGVTLFVGRHSFGELGLDTGTVGSVWLIYGIGYMIFSLLMTKIVTPARSKRLMLTSVVIAIIVLISLGLVPAKHVRWVQVLFWGIPLACSLFFNSYQAFMLGVDTGTAKPLAVTIAHYTFAWSLGYALGPAITVLCKQWGDWASVYYVTAGITAGLGVLTWFFKPKRSVETADPDPVLPAQAKGEPSFCPVAWLGILVGLGGWGMITTFWPVQSEALGLSTRIKGTVEFGAALTQALGGLTLGIFLPVWFFRIRSLAIIGLMGVLGALCFAFGGHWLIFTIGGILFGAYGGGYFSYLPFHAMVDPAKAVKRVAFNETFVGLAFLIGPLMANLIRKFEPDFRNAYVWVAVWAASGVIIQITLAWYLRKKHAYKEAA